MVAGRIWSGGTDHHSLSLKMLGAMHTLLLSVALHRRSGLSVDHRMTFLFLPLFRLVYSRRWSSAIIANGRRSSPKKNLNRKFKSKDKKARADQNRGDFSLSFSSKPREAGSSEKFVGGFFTHTHKVPNTLASFYTLLFELFSFWIAHSHKSSWTRSAIGYAGAPTYHYGYLISHSSNG